MEPPNAYFKRNIVILVKLLILSTIFCLKILVLFSQVDNYLLFSDKIRHYRIAIP